MGNLTKKSSKKTTSSTPAVTQQTAAPQTTAPAAAPSTTTPQSSATSGTVPNGFKGSATGVTTYNQGQSDILAQMNANSQAWHTADEAGKASLAAKNQALAQLLGGNVTFDSNTGYWSGAAEAPVETGEKPTFDYSEFEASRPDPYSGEHKTAIDKMLNDILTRDDFSYDPSKDPLYGYYQDMYRREGDRARENTLADIASSAGGMNSWAVTAAQQAQNDYNAQMTDKIPELYQLAYQMYLDDKASKVQDLGLLTQMDDTQYNRWMDTMSEWRNDRDFAYGVHRDDVGDYQWGTSFNYGASQDQISNNQWQQSFDTSNEQWDKQYAASQDETEYNREQTAQQNARAWALDLIALGGTPDPATLKAAGLTLDQAKQILANEQASGSRSSGGGGGSPSSSGVNPGSGVYQQMYDAGINSEGVAYTWLTSNGVKDSEASRLAKYYVGMLEDGSLEENTTAPKRLYDISIKRLGIKDDVSDETIATLVSMGALVEDGNYGYKWASGWNSDNWMAKYLKEKGFAPTLKPVGTSVK